MSTYPNQWCISAAVEDSDSSVLVCPHCGGARMRHTETRNTGSSVRIRFACGACDTQAAVVIGLRPDYSNITWEWWRVAAESRE